MKRSIITRNGEVMKRNLRATSVAGHLLLAVIVALWMIPTVGLLVSSFRTNAQI